MLRCIKEACVILPAVYRDGVVSRLLLLFLHCSNDVNHAFAISRDANLWPAVEMELTHRASLVFLKRCINNRLTNGL